MYFGLCCTALHNSFYGCLWFFFRSMEKSPIHMWTPLTARRFSLIEYWHHLYKNFHSWKLSWNISQLWMQWTSLSHVKVLHYCYNGFVLLPFSMIITLSYSQVMLLQRWLPSISSSIGTLYFRAACSHTITACQYWKERLIVCRNHPPIRNATSCYKCTIIFILVHKATRLFIRNYENHFLNMDDDNHFGSESDKLFHQQHQYITRSITMFTSYIFFVAWLDLAIAHHFN